MEKQIKELRVKIDGLSQLIKDLKPYRNEICNPPEFEIEEFNTNSKEIEKSYDSLILAKAWLGKVLQELGIETPYKNDGNRKTVEDIEPTTDTESTADPMGLTHNNHLGFVYTWSKKNHIEKVDWLRQQIDSITSIDLGADDIHREVGLDAVIYFQHFMKEISEARFWLGFELQRIKETNGKEDTNKII